MKRILEYANNLKATRLFAVFCCDKISKNDKKLCFQTANGPIFQCVGVYGDLELINFIHTISSNSELISSIETNYFELNNCIIKAKVFYEHRSWQEIFTYEFTDENICNIIDKFKFVSFRKNHVHYECDHKMCDICYLNDIEYCNCAAETSTYTYFKCRCNENLNIDSINKKINSSLHNYTMLCISEDEKNIILNDKHPDHNKICKNTIFRASLYYS